MCARPLSECSGWTVSDLAPLQVGVIPEGRYAQGCRSPIVWVWLCARCAGFAPTVHPAEHQYKGNRCKGCGIPGLELHRFRAYIDSISGCSCERQPCPVVGDLEGLEQ